MPMYFWSSEYGKTIVNEECGTGAASYKWLVQVSPIFSVFSVCFLEILCVCSNSVVPFCYMYILLWITTERI